MTRITSLKEEEDKIINHAKTMSSIKSKEDRDYLTHEYLKTTQRHLTSSKEDMTSTLKTLL